MPALSKRTIWIAVGKKPPARLSMRLFSSANTPPFPTALLSLSTQSGCLICVKVMVPPQGGRPGWAAPPDPRIGPWLRLLKKIAQSHNLVPEFEAVRMSTGRGKMLLKSLLLLVWEGLGLGGGDAAGNWCRSFKSWQKNAISAFLGEQNIKIGKPNDFI